MCVFLFAVLGLSSCQEAGRIGAVPADPDFEADIVEGLPQDTGLADAGADVQADDPSEPGPTVGDACEGPEECATAICFDWDEDDDDPGLCTEACDGRCDIAGMVCFFDYCVPTDYCEGDDGGGLGPGCDGSPCEQCGADEQCAAGAGRGVYECVPGDT